MTARPSILRTQAEKDLIDQFAARSTGATVPTLRAAAFASFEAAGLPHRRVEAYKYTDLRALIRAVPASVAPAAANAVRSAAAWPEALAAVARYRLVFVDGAYQPALSEIAGLGGVTIGSLAAALQAGTAAVNAIAPAEADPTFDLNAALMQDGAVIRVADGAAIDKPIEIAHVATQAASSFYRHLITVGANAKVELIESFAGPDGVGYHVNSVTELDVGAQAEVHLTKLQTEGDASVHLANLAVRLGDHARLEHFALSTGALTARAQVFATFAGSHAALATRGATLVNGRQHADATLVVDHAKPHGVSREIYKAVVDGSAKSVFQGKIVVKPHAQKTDGLMSSRAVMLSDDCEAMNKPELEIFADDVVCGHGATTGEIDERLRFYLMSRGIPRVEAEKLLLIAFLGEAVDGIANEALRETVSAAIEAWLERRAG